jgi:uncharacterized protein YyaL (SSP411 family)
MKDSKFSATIYAVSALAILGISKVGFSANQESKVMNSTKKANRLALEKSPYLLQHAFHPVDWMPWGEEAFEKARKENKPVLLSIGYSTCHWCHVMAHESFEDPATAEVLNKYFICIKVDREERPDVDRLYMAYVQATTGSGGWPLNVWLTPEREPFFGGTYFPPKDRFGRPAFSSLLERIAKAWSGERSSIVESARQSLGALRSESLIPASPQTPETTVLDAAFQKWLSEFDAEEGGFGKAPKFPRPATLLFLMRHARSAGAQSKEGPLAAAMVFQTLRKMALGGMNDQLGGGFHRYSVDRFWHVPHYEKMLYDQAQISACLVEAAQLSGDAFFEYHARRTLDYVRNEMTHPEGGFYSAEDADSLYEEGKPEHGEGAFYLWRAEEIDNALGDNAPLFKEVYGVHPEGNSPQGSDPHGELRGKNTLIRRFSDSEAAEKFGLTLEQTTRALETARARLLSLRAQRPKPHRDDKILTAWNGLMISAFARAGAFTAEKSYVEAAQKAAGFIRKNLWKKGRLYRSHRVETGSVEAFAEDYAFLIQGLLDLYEADFQTQWIQWALTLQEKLDLSFWDPKAGGYFSSAEGDSSVSVRMKENHDGAEPAASSVAAHNLLRLAGITGDERFRDRAQKAVRAFGTPMKEASTSLPRMLCTVHALQSPPRQIVIAGDLNAPDTQALLRVVRARFLPDTVLMHAHPESEKAGLGEKFSAISQMKTREGKATAYVCENFICEFPETSPEKLAERLKTR